MNTARYTGEQLANVARKMLDMPEPVVEKKHSKQDAVRLLSKEIAAMRLKGYTMESIAQIMSSHGIAITHATLKNYMRRAIVEASKSTSKKTPQRTPQKHAASAKTGSEVRTARKQGTAIATDEIAKQSSKATFTPKPDSDEI